MDRRYVRFCAVDPLFYDSPDSARVGPETGALVRAVAVPHGWRDAVGTVWRILLPIEGVLPEQGWKLHVSATPQNAERVLRVVADYCLAERVAFKHLRSHRVLVVRNAKYAERASSGKFVTIYPRDLDEFETTLTELDRRLVGESGPYVLSDVRVGAGPLYARYGAFAPLWIHQDGRRVPAIRRPDGALVADVREPRFVVPSWVAVPDCLRDHERTRRSGSASALRYRVLAALHFSNSGGVYRAARAGPDDAAWWPSRGDGDEIVLKEARPHAGLDDRGLDAVARLEHEHAVLCRLSDVTAVPAVGEPFDAGGHRFLPQQLMPGLALPRWVARNFPLSGAAADERAVAGYTRRALAVADRVAAALDAVHARGVALGDLHPANVLVDERDEVSLIDFELAEDVDAPHHGLGAPGFVTPAGGVAREADRAALAVLRLWMFHPTAAVVALSRAPLAGWIDHVRRRFPVPASWAAQRRAELLDERVVTPPLALPARRGPGVDRDRLRAALVAGVLAAATPDRDDRLFPGDIRQFDVDGVCFGYGAAGVLHALRLAGADPVDEHERWLLRAIERRPPLRPGFWEGAHGVAWVLDGLGHREAADQLLDRVAGADACGTVGLRDGGAGVGLVLLDLAERRGDAHLRDRGLAVAAELAERSERAERAERAETTGRRLPGLLDGWSGVALLQVRAHEVTDDPTWLAHAEQALRRDLDGCVTGPHGELSVRDPERAVTLPYLATGSAGVALAAHALASRTDASPTGARAALPALLTACRTEFVVHAGLADGAAGLLHTLRRTAPHEPDVPTRRAVDRHLAAITRHLVPHGDGLLVAGHQLLRLSTDVATGNAGLLLALADDDHDPGLPLPDPRRAAATLVP